MANDITTLAIALQSREAEANLKTFNELLVTGSENAKKMESMTIGVNVDEAVRQLAAFKQSFDDIAASAQNIHFDLGTNMPQMATPPPTVDTAALEELKAFFQESAEEMRRQSEALTESLGKMGAGAETSGASVRTAGESMRGASAATGEYAKKVRELNAAQKEAEKLDAKAAANRQAAWDAREKAIEAKEKLARAQERLNDDRERLAFVGNDKIRQRLIEKVNELAEAYEKARKESKKFDLTLDASSDAADKARAKYEQLKAELAGMPAPTGKVAVAVDTFEKNARRAGTTATKLARGFNAVAFAGGAAVPGLSKLGLAISMFSYSGPVVGAAIVGIGALSIAIKKFHEKCRAEHQFVGETAEYALKLANSTKEFVSSSESDWKRLGELSGMESLTNAQNNEAIAIIERLTSVYGDLGIEIDNATGKLIGYGDARARANREDRELQERAMKSAMNRAQESYTGTLLSFQNSYGNVNLFKAEGERLLKLLNDKNTPANEIWNEFERLISKTERIKTKQDIATDYSDFEWVNVWNDFNPKKDARWLGEISSVSADKFSTALKKLKEDFDELSKRKRDIEKFSTSDIEKYSQSVGELAGKLKDAENKLVDEDGVLRLKTEEEVYQAQKARISAIGAELKDVREKAAADEMAILNNGKQAGVYLKELELERTNLLEKTLTYEQRISAEKDKQRKALNDAIDAEQMRVNTFKSGYIVNQNGGLVRQKNADELAKDRTEDIKALQSLISEKGYGKTLEEEKELISARLELARLQAEQIKYRDQVKTANEAAKNAAKGYVFDSKGAVVRKKTEDELEKERQKELAAARKRVEAAEKGTVERAQAEAELNRLEIEAYNRRQKNAAATVMNEARANNSRMVQGIEARSTAALALETRVFRRDESEKAIMRDSKDIQTDIKDIVGKMLTSVTDFSTTFADVKDLLQPL